MNESNTSNPNCDGGSSPPAPAPLHSDFLTEKDVARRLNVSVGLVRKWRFHGTGPRYYKFGAAVRYASTHLAEYQQKSLVVTKPAA